MAVAFALKESVEKKDFSGAVSVRGGESLNVGEVLAEGGGSYVTEDPQEIEALDAYDAVKRVSVEEAAKAAERRQARQKKD